MLLLSINKFLFDKPQRQKPINYPQNIETSFIPDEELISSLKDSESNQFVQFLIKLFGVEIANLLVRRYFIGTSNHWKGSTVFWQVNSKGKICTGKIIQYEIVDSDYSIIGKDCNRIRTNTPKVYWVHSILKIKT